MTSESGRGFYYRDTSAELGEPSSGVGEIAEEGDDKLGWGPNSKINAEEGELEPRSPGSHEDSNSPAYRLDHQAVIRWRPS